MTQLHPIPFYGPQECICGYTELSVIHYYVNEDQRLWGRQVGRKGIVPDETFACLH